MAISDGNKIKDAVKVEIVTRDKRQKQPRKDCPVCNGKGRYQLSKLTDTEFDANVKCMCGAIIDKEWPLFKDEWEEKLKLRNKNNHE